MAHVALFRIATMSPSAAVAMVCSAVQCRVIKTACIASVVFHSLLGSWPWLTYAFMPHVSHMAWELRLILASLVDIYSTRSGVHQGANFCSEDVQLQVLCLSVVLSCQCCWQVWWLSCTIGNSIPWFQTSSLQGWSWWGTLKSIADLSLFLECVVCSSPHMTHHQVCYNNLGGKWLQFSLDIDFSLWPKTGWGLSFVQYIAVIMVTVTMRCPGCCSASPIKTTLC